MENFVGCTLALTLFAAAVVVWSGIIYASNLLGAALFGG